MSLSSIMLCLIVGGFQNKRFVRDVLIDVNSLEKRFHVNFNIVELVFNRNALKINDVGKRVYFMRLNAQSDTRASKISLQESLIESEESGESFRFTNIEDEEYQDLFLGWQGFIF